VLATADVVALSKPTDLVRPTPCGEWSLRELLAHMIAQHHGFAAAAEGHGGDLAAWQLDAVGDDAPAAYARAAERVVAAFAVEGVPERAFALPELSPTSTFPGAQAIGFHLVDVVTHGWDVAKSIGVEIELDPETLHAALVVALAVPDSPRRREPGALFRPAVAVPADAPVLDRIVAHLGRSPRWPED
jgi:uncharacterized protein (TIGR03086 family)